MSADIVERLRLNCTDWVFGNTAATAMKEILNLRTKVAALEELLEEAYADADDVLRPRIAQLEAENDKIMWASQYAKAYEELRAVIDGGGESIDHAQAIQEVKDLQAENATLREVKDGIQYIINEAKLTTRQYEVCRQVMVLIDEALK